MSDLENGTAMMDKQAKRRAAQKAWREKNPGYFKTYAADVKAGVRVRKPRNGTNEPVSGAVNTPVATAPDASILGTSTQAAGGCSTDD